MVEDAGALIARCEDHATLVYENTACLAGMCIECAQGEAVDAERTIRGWTVALEGGRSATVTHGALLEKQRTPLTNERS